MKKESPRELLQYIKKSCIIDSIRFENKVISVYLFIKKNGLDLYTKIKKINSWLIMYVVKYLRTVKGSIRKKLFPQQNINEVSEFISELKK